MRRAGVWRGAIADLALLSTDAVDSGVAIGIVLEDAIFKETDRAIREDVDAVLVEMVLSVFMFDGGEPDGKELIWAKWRRKPYLVIHEHERIGPRTGGMIQVGLIRIEVAIR
jgi:hypothetical protein